MSWKPLYKDLGQIDLLNETSSFQNRKARIRRDHNWDALRDWGRIFSGRLDDYMTNLDQKINNQIAGNTIKDEEIDFRHSDILQDTFTTMKERGDFWDNELQNRAINVSWFGAIGDGKTDDSDALIKAHDYANKHRYDVIYEKNRVYYISNSKEITIKTNVDFNHSKILIDDTVGSQAHLFHVINDAEPIQIDSDTVGPVASSITNDAFAGYGNAYVYVEDNTQMIYKRAGDNADRGYAKGEGFIVNNDGTIISPLMFDYDKVSFAELRKFNSSEITLKNGQFISTGFVTGKNLNASYKRDIFIERNGVNIINCSHSLVDDKAGKLASQGFFFHYRCASELMQNITVQPRHFTTVENVPRGTYEIGNYDVVEISYKQVNGFSLSSSLWGCFGGFRMKDVIFENVKLNRIDSHLPSQNVYIRHSAIGDKGIRLTGFGDLEISNTTIYSFTALSLREDYGATWDGNIVIKDSKLDTRQYNNQEATFSIINVAGQVDHDYGFPLYLGKDSIRIDNFSFLENPSRPDKCVVFQIALTDNATGDPISPHYMATTVDINNVTRQYGWAPKIFGINAGFEYLIGQSESQFKFLDESRYTGNINIISNVDINISNTLLWQHHKKASPFIASGSFFNNQFSGALAIENTIVNNNYGYGMIPNFHVMNCKEVNATTEGYACILTIENTTIAGMYCIGEGARTLLRVNNCNFVPRPNNPEKDEILRCAIGSSFFVNCIFKSGYSYEDATNTDSKNTAQQNIVAYEMLFSGVSSFPTTWFQPQGTFTNCTFAPDFDTSKIFNAAKFSNIFPGQKGYFATIVKGTTAERPAKATIGTFYFDTDQNKLVYWNGSSWQ